MICCILSVVENRSALVKEVIYAELDATFDYPPQRPIIVIRHVVHQERIVEASFIW